MSKSSSPMNILATAIHSSFFFQLFYLPIASSSFISCLAPFSIQPPSTLDDKSVNNTLTSDLAGSLNKSEARHHT